MIKDSKEKYGVISKYFHWVSAIIIVSLFFLGKNTDLSVRTGGDATVFLIHAWLGMTFIIILLGRIFWRLSNRDPEPVESFGKFGVITYKIVSYSFYALMLTAVTSGLSLMLSIDNYREAVFSFQADVAPATQTNYTIARNAYQIHETSTLFIIILAIFHTLAAFFHYFFKKDNVFQRMWYGN